MFNAVCDTVTLTFIMTLITIALCSIIFPRRTCLVIIYLALPPQFVESSEIMTFIIPFLVSRIVCSTIHLGDNRFREGDFRARL